MRARPDGNDHRRTLWWATARPAPATQELQGDSEADVAVIGAGFVGLTAAWHLARRGVRVVVLEAATLGSGASGRNAGFVVPNFAKADPATVVARLGRDRGERLLKTIGAGADRVFATIRDEKISCDAEQVGWMHVAHSPAMLDVLAKRAAAWQALDRPVRILGAEEARHLTGARHCVGALLDPSGGMLHPLDYVYGLARSALAAGATIHEHARVHAMSRDGERWTLSSGRFSVRAARVLLCTNAFSIGVAQRLYRSIVPLPVYQIATAPLPEESVRRFARQRHPVADTRSNLFTYRLDRDNRLISGGMAMLPIAAHGRLGTAIVARLQAELGLPDRPQLAHVWRGEAAITPDFLPHLYEFGPGFIGGIGCNGRGIAVTAMVGEALADAATGRPLSELPIPEAPARAIPFHALSRVAASAAVAQAKWQDRHLG